MSMSERFSSYRFGRPLRSAAAATALVLLLCACSARDSVSARDFVGKWKSSRLETPLFLHDNGEWEIRTDDGAVLQYGVWQYSNKSLLWSYKLGARVGHDRNAVISVAPREIRLREEDGGMTTFVRLE